MPRSFLDIAAESHFPIQNLPFGVFRPAVGGQARVGVAIGECVLDLLIIEELGFFRSPEFGDVRPFGNDSLNAFMALGRPAWRKAREVIQHLLDENTATIRDDAILRSHALHRMSEVVMLLPARIGDYTDFYSSYHHAHNVGTMLRGAENALMPNWLHLPVGYHGRASSIVPSGTEVRRPHGQVKPPDAAAPVFVPTRFLDYELEVAFFTGPGNPLGEPISIDRAEEHIFGFVLMNDWSARDVQTWEYQPLGPFLAKNFCTSISPWVVTLEALEPFRLPLPPQDPVPLPYLRRSDGDSTFDIQLEASLQTPSLETAHVLTRTNFRHLYWSPAQQLAHHACGGSNLLPGDLLASGTVSGPTEDSRGCFLELTWRGANPITLPDGEKRRQIEDGDTVRITGWAQGDGYRVGFGEVSGRVLPAR